MRVSMVPCACNLLASATFATLPLFELFTALELNAVHFATHLYAFFGHLHVSIVPCACHSLDGTEFADSKDHFACPDFLADGFT